MREVCARAAAGDPAPVTLATLGVDTGREVELRVGDVVHVRVHDKSWQLRIVREPDADWLVVTDVTVAERATASVVELCRLRALAAAATGVVHDLNNLLNAALGLASQLEPHVRDAADRRIVRELASGTRQGAQLLRAVARSLSRPPRDRVSVDAASLVEEAMALAAKAAATHGVQVAIEAPAAPVVARTVAAEAVQVLWHGAMLALERGPRRLAIAIDRAREPLGAARTREWARVCMRATGIASGAVAEVVALAAGGEGLLASCARSPVAAGFAAAVFVQRRLGGDLAVRGQVDGIELEYRWPAVS
jgi:signal transduction histidine kinase